MTSDINGTVTGLQGNAVSSASPTDGYVLTWDATDGYWVAKPAPRSGLKTDYFTSSGTWTCPDGVTSVLIVAAGGGSGGFQIVVGQDTGGPGGNSAFQVSSNLNTISGTTYTITIGVGGAGGIGMKKTQPDNNTPATTLINAVNPTSGTSTTFVNGSIVLFSVSGAIYNVPPTLTFLNTYNDGTVGSSYSSGIANTAQGGAGGQFGPQGNGGDGGNGNSSIHGSSATSGNGSNAGNNTGAGGGGGGACNNGGTPYTCQAGNGGNGGSGYLYIIY
jgi:hypothetical protein